MEQGNIDSTNSIAYLGLAFLTATFLAATFFMGTVGQKVYINPKLEVSADTICTEESRWYYSNDSSSTTIRVALYKEKGFSPYEVVYLAPDDYADVKLQEGYNTVIIKTLDRKYPGLKTKYRILQLKPIPKPKFNLKRFFE
jgi:hypothetical protein